MILRARKRITECRNSRQMEAAWKEPLCLIKSESSNHLEVVEETAEKLLEVRLPLVIVGVAGYYRTGKSYILNMLAGKTKGFCLGSSIQSCTKGIWVWLIEHPKNPEGRLLLVDTEGLGDAYKGSRNHDTWIFTLTVLLSNVLIYNSKGAIDNDAIEKLQFVSKMADHINIRTTKDASTEAEEDDVDGEILQNICPFFIWAVRDFTLQLEDRNGKSITSDEYLETALQDLKGKKTSALRKQNVCRESIREFFKSHKCFTFPIPVKESSQMVNLENLTADELAPEFQSVADQLRDYVYGLDIPKMAHGMPVQGPLFVGLAKLYVKALMKGAIPCIQNAVESTAELENNRAIASSLEMYRQLMNEKVQVPTESLEALSDFHIKFQEQCVEYFNMKSLFDKEEIYLKSLQEELNSTFKEQRIRNDDASDEKSRMALIEVSQELNDKVAAGDYARPGGYSQYEADLKAVEEQYNTIPNKGLRADANWHAFLEQKENERRFILAGDEKLTDCEKEVEEQRLLAEKMLREKQQAEETRQQKEKELDEAKKRHEKEMQQAESGHKILATVLDFAGKAFESGAQAFTMYHMLKGKR